MKTFGIILTIVVIAGIGYWIYITQNDQVACTLEAKLCPDGSAVGRTGINCEFTPCPGENTFEFSQSYSSPVNGFSIRYPEEFGFLVTREQIESLGYIPLCDPETSLICVVYLEKLLPGRNFQGGGVAVGILTDRKNEASCLRSENEMGISSSMTIDGVPFAGFRYGDAAAGHQVSGVNYRAFTNDRCYQIATRIKTTTFENYEPGTIQRFTEAERQSVEQSLQDVIANIQFISANPVSAGQGTVNGYVHVGPTCPVERIPPDPNCADRPHSVSIEIHYPDERLLRIIRSGSDGRFTTTLAAGSYIFRPQVANVLPVCEEERVNVRSGQITTIDISCDSGIR